MSLYNEDDTAGKKSQNKSGVSQTYKAVFLGGQKGAQGIQFAHHGLIRFGGIIQDIFHGRFVLVVVQTHKIPEKQDVKERAVDIRLRT